VQRRKSSWSSCLVFHGEHSPELSRFRELWPGNFPFRPLDKGIWSVHTQPQLECETLLVNRLTEADNLETFPEFCPARICLYMGSRKKWWRRKKERNMVEKRGKSKREVIPALGCISERK